MTFQLLGVFGGAFDPIHNGHLAVAEHLMQALSFDSFHFVPTGCPPHRQPFIASAAQRVAMLKLALQDQAKLHSESADNFVINTQEIERSQTSSLPTYTVDTLTELHRQFPSHALCLILGYDAWQHFNEWHEWQTILTLTHVVIVNRPESVLSVTSWSQTVLAQHQVHNATPLHQQQAGCILLQAIPPSPISATDIRHQLQFGKNRSLATDLSPSVLDYIHQHHLYACQAST